MKGFPFFLSKMVGCEKSSKSRNMKKFLSIVVLLILLAPVTQAATLFSDQYNTFYQNESKGLWPITVTAEADGEITAKNGINLLVDAKNLKMMWDAVPELTASGTAITQGKVASKPKPEFLNDYAVLNIPVLADFAKGESVTFTGIRMRAYKYAFTRNFIQLDITGDQLADATDVNIITVSEITVLDRTPPYPPTQFSATLSPDLKSISLSWSRSVDFDVFGMNLDRKRVRAGHVQEINLLSKASMSEYVDTDIQLGDIITYSLSGDDNANLGEVVTRTIEVKAPAPETPVPPPSTETPPSEVQPADESETSLLTRLYSYYKIREEIKCREGVDPGDSACLWAKIDVVYTQEFLNRFDVNIALSARDLELMALRIVWPEKRYQAKCVEATVPDASCPALEKSIKRAHYFIDQQ